MKFTRQVVLRKWQKDEIMNDDQDVADADKVTDYEDRSGEDEDPDIADKDEIVEDNTEAMEDKETNEITGEDEDEEAVEDEEDAFGYGGLSPASSDSDDVMTR
jgi:hypothetical protein